MQERRGRVQKEEREGLKTHQRGERESRVFERGGLFVDFAPYGERWPKPLVTWHKLLWLFFARACMLTCILLLLSPLVKGA